MHPRFTHPDPRIDAVRDCVAVERGPIVLCAESPDGAIDLDRVRVDPDVPPADYAASATPAENEKNPEQSTVSVSAVLEQTASTAWPYADAAAGGARTPTSLRLIPYHRWGRQGPATMRIWLPKT
ncbi:MAG: hypothetical protein HOV76_32010 [Hamadaea sp.]|nr:hypothetical protein [Hamadaea sp.]